MLDLNNIYNENCFETMKKMNDENIKVDIILTSPPYNTSRIGRSDKYSTRYTGFEDNKTDEEYIEWSINLFNNFDKALKENGCILYNISYSSEKPDLLWRVIGEIINNTNFTTADCIIWKKKSALPNNVSKNKLTRIVEYIFVFARKSEILTFECNKKVKSINKKTNQKFYENVFNYIEAPNNDGKCDLNRSTYSSELCEKLLNIYAKENQIIYDPFMGTGTTAIGCLKTNNNFIGSEISKEQCKYANNRIYTYIKENNPKIYYDEFKEALIDYKADNVIYDYNKCIKLLINQGMTYDKAEEYLNTNYLYLEHNFPIFKEIN